MGDYKDDRCHLLDISDERLQLVLRQVERKYLDPWFLRHQQHGNCRGEEGTLCLQVLQLYRQPTAGQIAVWSLGECCLLGAYQSSAGGSDGETVRRQPLQHLRMKVWKVILTPPHPRLVDQPAPLHVVLWLQTRAAVLHTAKQEVGPEGEHDQELGIKNKSGS